MKMVFLGPPGAGKGTQAKMHAEEVGIPHISTGDMLRTAVAAGSELGARVQAVMDSGELVSDDLMIEIIEDRISQADCAKGYILDGFPRTVPQAEALAALLERRKESLGRVVLFDVSMEQLLARLENRRQAENRADDSIETQRQRLEVYEQKTAPLIDFYESRGELLRVDSSGDIEVVKAAFEQAIAK